MNTNKIINEHIFFIYLRSFAFICGYFYIIALSTICFAGQQKPLRVILDWFINPDHAPLFVAEQQGFYKKHGIAVKFIPPADPADATKLVAAGQADIAITYQPHFILDVARKMPLVRIATLVPVPLDCLITLKNGPIHRIEDLKGKRIGFSQAGSDDVMLKVMLKNHGLSLKDVELVNVHYGLTQALLAGRIDAFSGAMRNFEPIEMALAGHPARVFYPEENGMPLYEELILVTNKNELQDPRLKSFVEALREGVIYLINHPESSWKKFAKNHPELNNELNHKVWNATLPYFDLRPGLLDEEQYRKYESFLQREGLFLSRDSSSIE